MEYDSFSKYINGAVKVLWVILNYFSDIKSNTGLKQCEGK